MPPEGFVVSAVVPAFVRHHPQQPVAVLVQDAAQGQQFGETDFGHVFRAAAVRVPHAARQVDGEDLQEDGDAHVPCDAPFRRL